MLHMLKQLKQMMMMMMMMILYMIYVYRYIYIYIHIQILYPYLKMYISYIYRNRKYDDQDYSIEMSYHLVVDVIKRKNNYRIETMNMGLN